MTWREYKQKIEKLDKELEDTQRIKKGLKEQKENLDELVYSEKSKLHKEYKDAREEAKKAIKAKISKEGHRHLNVAHTKASNIKTQKITEVEELKIGDRVKYRTSKGVLVSIKGQQAFIENDSGMKMKVPLKDLSRSGNMPKPTIKPKTTLTVAKPDSGDVKLDLHGQRVDEALENLDKFLSDALIAGFDEVLVYHGIGTGKLAAATKKYLDKHPKIRSYEDAHPSSGGFGAKVIKL